MVIHAPPFNILAIILIPASFIPDPKTREKVSQLFSKGVFWIENIVGVTFFVAFEFILLPILFVKCLFNIIVCTNGMFTTVFNKSMLIFLRPRTDAR